MKRYRKKPIVIEAVQWSGDNVAEISKFAQRDLAIKTDLLSFNQYLLIPTLEGEMSAIVGDYIIKRIKNEIYPCKPDIFEATYELVD